MIGNLSPRVTPLQVFGAVATGTSVQTGTTVQPQGGAIGSIYFIITFGTVTLNTGTPNVYVTASDDDTTYTQLTDPVTAAVLKRALAAGHTGKSLVIEVAQPKHAYYKLVVDRTGVTACAIVSATALLVSDRKQPAGSSYGDAFSADVFQDNNA